MAKMLAKKKHIVYLLPELGGGKHPDAIVDGELTEFKRVTGGLHSLGQNFSKARKQGDNVFLCIDAKVTRKEVYHKLVGEVRYHGYTGGKIYVCINGRMNNWNVDDLK